MFPAHGSRGFIQEPKFAFQLIEKATGIKASPHDLRRTFATTAKAVRLPAIEKKALLNHAVADRDDVTEGYEQVDSQDIAKAAQKVVNKLRGQCKAAPAKRGKPELAVVAA